MKKMIGVILVLSLMCGLGTCAYFVAGVSAVAPPIKTYECDVSINRFENAVEYLVDRDTAISYDITDVVGNAKNGYATYINIFDKTQGFDNEYKLKYEALGKSNKSRLMFLFRISRFTLTESLPNKGKWCFKSC